jgi:hypothetical protein
MSFPLSPASRPSLSIGAFVVVLILTGCGGPAPDSSVDLQSASEFRTPGWSSDAHRRRFHARVIAFTFAGHLQQMLTPPRETG